MKLFLSLALFAAFLLGPSACADGMRYGLSLAAREALPALFPFFVTSALLVRTGFADALGRLAARPLARLYGLPPAAAPAVILGLTGGYPVGAATADELLQQGALSPKAAARVNSFCNCASPGFCIGLIGLGLFGSARTGAVLYIVHILAALLAGLLTARDRGTPRAFPAISRPSAPQEGFATAFCAAVRQAAATALTVTAFLTVFSILLQLAAPVLARVPCGAALAGVIELTNGLDRLPLLPLPTGALLTLASFLLGFGGRNRRAGGTAGGWLCRRQTAARRALRPAHRTAFPAFPGRADGVCPGTGCSVPVPPAVRRTAGCRSLVSNLG